MVVAAMKIVMILFLLEFISFSRTYERNETDNNNDETPVYREKRHVIPKPCSYPKIKCSRFERYRRADGTCNNLKTPIWGSSLAQVTRILPNSYDDGLNSPRTKGVGGLPLPSTRKISNEVLTSEVNKPMKTIFTNLFQTYGQFLDHDIDFSPTMQDADGKAIKCCTEELIKNWDVSAISGPCFPIEIPVNDTFLKPRRCMNFVRSMEVKDPDLKCQSPVREQKNVLTSYVDGSNVYGNNNERLDKIRLFKDGLMKVSKYGMLPPNPDGVCNKRTSADRCSLAGDPRADEHPGLTAYHTIFLRMHNRIARQLRRINRRWNDERLFQETRTIVAAILQHITYNEWLPLVVGTEATRKYRLRSDTNSWHRYNPNIDPRIINAFSTAAFRYGHSSIPNEWKYGNKHLPIVEMFMRPFVIYDFKGRGLDLLVEGMLTDSSQDADQIFGDGVKNRLFETLLKAGMDLPAINTQRGRDHGLAPYNEYRKLCRLKPIRFDGSTAQVRALARAYRHPDDVDLFIGGVTELPVRDGVVGKTFACIIGQQFFNIKYGDRYWFENLQPPSYYNYHLYNPSALTKAQVRAIKDMTMARVLCYNTKVRNVPRQAFLHPKSYKTMVVSCKDKYALPVLDLTEWKDLSTYG